MFFPDSFPFPRLRKYEEFLKDTMTLSRKYQRRVELSIRRAFVSLTGGGGEFPTYIPTFLHFHFVPWWCESCATGRFSWSSWWWWWSPPAPPPPRPPGR